MVQQGVRPGSRVPSAQSSWWTTPGQRRWVSDASDPELMWALRGGGR